MVAVKNAELAAADRQGMAAARYAHWARSPPHAFSPGLRPRNRAHWSDGCTIPDVTLNRSLVLDGPGSEPVARLVRRLEHGAPVQLAVLGASVTSGHGITESPVSNYTWPAQLERAMRYVWRNPLVRVHNAAMPSTTAAFAAMCIDTLVPMRVDLILIEYSFTTFHAEQLQSLIEEARARATAVMVVEYANLAAGRDGLRIPWNTCKMWKRKPEKTDPLGRNCTPAVVLPHPPYDDLDSVRVRHGEMLAASGLPVVSIQPFAPMLRDFGFGGATDLRRFLAGDGIHLSSMGHWLYVRAIMHALWTTPRRSTATEHRRRSGRSAGGQATARSTCAFRSNLEALVRPAAAQPTADAAAWRYVVERRDKPGLVSREPGGVVELGVPYAGEAAAVHLIYLKSYEHMGQARFECRGGCSCRAATIDAHNERRVSLETPAAPIEVAFAPGTAECRLRGVTLQSTRSGEHKFKLTALVVTPLAFKVKSGIVDVASFVDWSTKEVYAHAASLHGT